MTKTLRFVQKVVAMVDFLRGGVELFWGKCSFSSSGDIDSCWIYNGQYHISELVHHFWDHANLKELENKSRL